MFTKIYPRDFITNRIECSKNLDIRNLEIDSFSNLVELYIDSYVDDINSQISKTPYDVKRNINSLYNNVGITLYNQDYRFYYHLAYNKKSLKKDYFELIDITPIMECT